MEELDVAELSQRFGLGDFPILNEENRRLHRKLVEREIDVVKIRASAEQERDGFTGLFGHSENVKEAVDAKRRFLGAKKTELESETDVFKISRLSRLKTRKDSDEVIGAKEAVLEVVEGLEARIQDTEDILDHLENEVFVDSETIAKWTLDVDGYEEDIVQLLKYQYHDQIKIKNELLKVEKLRERLSQRKKTLEASSTENRMAQLALDKTAEEFRAVHKDRQEVMNKWNEASELVQKRDAELTVAYEKVNVAREAVRRQTVELQEQRAFLGNEVGNVKELERTIQVTEKKAQALFEEMNGKDEELDEIESGIMLEKRETMAISGEIGNKRARLKELKAERNAKNRRVEAISANIEELKDRKQQHSNMAMSSEDKAQAMERILESEQRQQESLQWELEKVKERKLQKESELQKTVGRDEANALKIKALTMEKRNLGGKIKTKKEEVMKKEDVLVMSDQKLAQIERQIAKMDGTLAAENRAQLKVLLEQLKKELDKKFSDKRNMDYLVHKMEADCKKISRDIETLRKEDQRVRVNLEEIELVIETSKKHQRQLLDSVEALLLEEKMLKLTERKVRDELERINNEIFELNKHDLTMNERMREEKHDLEAKRDLFLVQHRTLKEELSAVRVETRERLDRADKLRIRYEHLIKSLGGGPEDTTKMKSEEVPSHAYHLVKLAQEKAELQERGVVLNHKLEREEKEMIALEKAMTMLKNSNGKYRATNLKRELMESGDVKDIQERIKKKSDEIEEKRNALVELEQSVRQKEVLIAKTEYELEHSQVLYDEKSSELKQIEREVHEQDKKLSRAQHSKTAARKEAKEHAPNIEAYEEDMNLREEREKQRGALIKLREISFIDPEFNETCQHEMNRIGVAAPAVSRLESRSRSSSRTPTSRPTSLYRSRRASAESRGSTTSSVKASKVQLLVEVSRVQPWMPPPMHAN